MTGFEQPQRVVWYDMNGELFRIDSVPVDKSVDICIIDIRRTDKSLRDCDYVILGD